MLVLALPFPPAVNNLFATYRNRRIPTRAYNAWLGSAAEALAGQSWTPVVERARIALVLSAPDRRERDADNYLKAPIDFLVKSGVLQNDSASYVRKVSAEWSDDLPAKPGGVVLTIEAAA